MEKIFQAGARVFTCIPTGEGDKVLSGTIYRVLFEGFQREYQVLWDSCVGCTWAQTTDFPANYLFESKKDAIDEVINAKQKLIEDKKQEHDALVKRVEAEQQKLLDMYELGSHPHIHSPTCEGSTMMKDALEVLRYGRNIWKSSGGGFTSRDELEEYLSDTEDRMRVTLERKIPDKVLSALWRVSKIARRVSVVADHMSGVFVVQNDIAWETKQARVPSSHVCGCKGG